MIARYALRKRVLSTDYTDFSKRGLGFLCATSVSSVSPWLSSTTEAQRTQRLHREESQPVATQRRIESTMMTTAATMMIAVRLVLMRPWTDVSGFCVSGQKMSVIDLKPATSVVVLTNASGM